MRKQLGLDRPLPEQFLTYVLNLAQGNMGVSLRTKLPVTTEISTRFMPTMLLTLTSMAWSVVLGLSLIHI